MKIPVFDLKFPLNSRTLLILINTELKFPIFDLEVTSKFISYIKIMPVIKKPSVILAPKHIGLFIKHVRIKLALNLPESAPKCGGHCPVVPLA